MVKYSERFSLLLHIEEQQMQLDIRRYDMESVTMVKCKDDKALLELEVPGVAEKRPSVLVHDHLFACPLDMDGQRGNVEYKGYVHRVLNDKVALGFGRK
jgi:helicase MOV-10